ncbi:hypothetical protein Pelo_6539 [Pelomyxa schiedti]|nr:hypothetical protein Pelo_6539 [Pelomyxa schiedti]
MVLFRRLIALLGSCFLVGCTVLRGSGCLNEFTQELLFNALVHCATGVPQSVGYGDVLRSECDSDVRKLKVLMTVVSVEDNTGSPLSIELQKLVTVGSDALVCDLCMRIFIL